MSAEKPADIIPLSPVVDETPSGAVGRRTILQTFAAGVGAAFAIPGIAEAQQHPMQHHMATGAAAAAQKKVAGAYTPVLLDGHQMKTLEVLAEAIVPGSTEAKVAPFLDTLVGVDSTENQRQFMSALGAFDMFAIEKYNKPWIALTAADQDTLLQAASTTAPGSRPSFPGAPPAPGGKATIGDHFNNLKGWIAGAYFSSEKGARELGWDGNVFHAELPGCTHPDGHG
jgi:gluconate 2-dehydrogenase subunit 3-like protein